MNDKQNELQLKIKRNISLEAYEEKGTVSRFGGEINKFPEWLFQTKCIRKIIDSNIAILIVVFGAVYLVNTFKIIIYIFIDFSYLFWNILVDLELAKHQININW